MVDRVPSPPVTETTEVLASLAGGVLWGMARLYVAAFSPTPPRKRELAAALAETTAALVSAGIGGLYVSPYIVRLFHAETDRSASGLLCVMVGLGFWQSVPALRAVAAHFLPDRIALALGIKPRDLETVP